MVENSIPGPENPRRLILTSHSRQQLEGKILQLMLQGWERVGDVAVAKSVIDSEPPYFSQAMVQSLTAKNSGGEN